VKDFMKKSVLIILALGLAVALSSCGKKEKSLAEMQEPVSMEAIGNINAEVPAQPEVISVLPQAPVSPVPAVPATVSKSASNKDIQLALKSAGYYKGAVDGKLGPMTKKAIEDFQKANGLQPDGRVGPKTWAILSTYLSKGLEASPKKKQ
jgi:murein L,D-transpeptidase YcbB/YkuD